MSDAQSTMAALVRRGLVQQVAATNLAISIPRSLSIDISVNGELKKGDIAKIRSQFNRWIEGLEEAFGD